MNSDIPYWVGFSAFPGIGPVRFRLLYEYFGSASAAWKAQAGELLDIGLGEKLTSAFVCFRNTFDIDAYLQKLLSLHIVPVPYTDPKYPPHLKEISDAPFLLYVKGRRSEAPIDMRRMIAVVGTRRVSPYGREVTTRLVTELVQNGFTIVSGLAYGVDAIAHEAAIAAGGKTIAVLGCGIDIIAPSGNARLYDAIADGNGAIVSEMPLGLRPSKGIFPARNRIISGLSLGVVVTEGADDSGALITARYAGEQGREVFAVPGPITSPLSRASSRLLKAGATLVESAEDILEQLHIPGHAHPMHTAIKGVYEGDNEAEQKILAYLTRSQMHIDALVRETNLTMSQVAATLTVLEIKGIVKDYGEKVYGLT